MSTASHITDLLYTKAFCGILEYGTRYVLSGRVSLQTSCFLIRPVHVSAYGTFLTRQYM
jgi:hypothetical protein